MQYSFRVVLDNIRDDNAFAAIKSAMDVIVKELSKLKEPDNDPPFTITIYPEEPAQPPAGAATSG